MEPLDEAKFEHLTTWSRFDWSGVDFSQPECSRVQ